MSNGKMKKNSSKVMNVKRSQTEDTFHKIGKRNVKWKGELNCGLVVHGGTYSVFIALFC